MKLVQLTPNDWMTEQKKCVDFAIRYGDKRLALSSIHALRSLDPAALVEQPDLSHQACAISAIHRGRIIGFGYASNCSDACCMVVVHPGARSRGVGTAILQTMLERLGKLSCHVATDNTASMTMCFRLGMVAVSMHKGPTGKPTLRFERRSMNDRACPRHSNLISQ